jgi:hypothetical protein
MRVLELLILIELPFLKQGYCRILSQEISRESPFEGAPEEHGRPSVVSPVCQSDWSMSPFICLAIIDVVAGAVA